MNDICTPLHFSLFSGIGGIDLGLRSVVEGLRTVGYVEGEAFCIAHLVAQMEAGELDPAPVFPSFEEVDFRRFSGSVDIVSGGFPCQPFSQAGKRQGVEDPRHLWPGIVRALEVLRPQVAFFENVDGIASAKSPGYHSVLHHVLSDLEGLGFRATAGSHSAEEVGAPHRRKRWFILAVADSEDDHGRSGVVEKEAGVRPYGERRGGLAGGGQIVADAERERLQGIEQARTAEGAIDRPGCGGDPGWWSVEPDVGRVAHGVPLRMDRLRALGNSCVPTQAARAFQSLWGQLNP